MLGSKMVLAGGGASGAAAILVASARTSSRTASFLEAGAAEAGEMAGLPAHAGHSRTAGEHSPPHSGHIQYNIAIYTLEPKRFRICKRVTLCTAKYQPYLANSRHLKAHRP